MKFCSKCGTKIDEGIKFCPSCGEAVSNAENTPMKTEQEKVKLLYESKGGYKGGAIIVIILGLLFIGISIFMFSLFDISFDAVMNARILGGYVDNSVLIEALAVLVLIVYGIFIIRGGVLMIICYVKLYSDHIEAIAYPGNSVHVFYNQINSAYTKKGCVIIAAGGEKITLLCDDSKKVCELINQMIVK